MFTLGNINVRKSDHWIKFDKAMEAFGEAMEEGFAVFDDIDEKSLSGVSTITISEGGVTKTYSGKNVEILDKKVFINGKQVDVLK